jgi:hypothetical protein
LHPCPQNRQYLAVRVGNCTIRNFTLTVQTTASTSCRDIWAITLPVALLPRCGFSAVDVATAETFAGAVTVQYQDTLSVGSVQRTRITMATIPWRLSLNDEYRVSLVVGGVNVTSPVSLSAAVTSSNIRATADSALLTVALATQYPYQIAALNTFLSV